MPEVSLLIPYVPEKGWKVSGAVFVLLLLSFGLAIFVFSRARWDGYWAIWFGFIGSIAFMSLCSWRTEVFPGSARIVKTYYFLGFVPLRSKRFHLSAFSHIQRHVARAWGYDAGSEGIYRPVIYLVGTGDISVKLQCFGDCPVQGHVLSEQWANQIAAVTRLPVLDVIDSWEIKKK